VNDPVLARRERIRRLCDLGQRVGYSCFALAVVLFVVAFIAQFPSWLVTVIIAAMVIGSLVLAPAIVFGYGVKAADAEDRGEKFGY
jgi:sugar phosphate permease